MFVNLLGKLINANLTSIAVDHMRDVLNERQQLIQRIQALGGEIPAELR